MIAFEINPNTPDIRFLVSLSDGRTVIQDNIPGVKSAWLRLKDFLHENPDITMTCIRLQAPGGHDIAMPSGQKGYCYGNRQHRVIPGGQSTYMGIGYYDGTKAAFRWFNITNFSSSFVEEKTKEKAGFFLIENHEK